MPVLPGPSGYPVLYGGIQAKRHFSAEWKLFDDCRDLAVQQFIKSGNVQAVSQSMMAQYGYRKQNFAILQKVFSPSDSGIAVCRNGGGIHKRCIGNPWERGNKDFVQSFLFAFFKGFRFFSFLLFLCGILDILIEWVQ